MSEQDPRRRIPRTDVLLGDPALREAADRLGPEEVRRSVAAAQEAARRGDVAPEDVLAHAVAGLPASASSLVPVLNASGVVVHTNLGRAPLSAAAQRAVTDAAGYVDVELDLADGRRARRGSGALAALLSAVPSAEGALVVNNGAAALLLATTALAQGREVVVSRGELVEIGDGFRLTDLIASTGARLREIGTTNRTHLADYRDAVGEETGCLLKVHTSNFRVEGFTSAVEVDELVGLGVPVVADLGSGLLHPEPALPMEPDATTALSQGADLVLFSGDKLLGGPQAGIILGRADLVERLRRHPMARALRVDKLTLAALEATLRAGEPPVARALHTDPSALRARTRALATRLGLPEEAVVPHDGRVGGGGAAGHPLPGWALALPEETAPVLRCGRPAVLPRVHGGSCLVDLRCVEPGDDDRLAEAVARALASLDR